MHTSITVREAAGAELNKESHYSEQPDCLNLYEKVEATVSYFVNVTFSGSVIVLRHLVEDLWRMVVIFLLNK